MYINFYLAFWVPFYFWEAYFHKIKGRETFSRPHKDLNTTGVNTVLDRFISTEL
jgi:hypothetical protein